MKVNIKSIEAFKNISQSNLKALEKEVEIVKYSLGQPISTSDIIPNRVLIILEGEARFIYKTNNKISTLVKIGKGYFIGLASILNVKGCEFMNASTEIIAMSISDNF